MIRLVLVSALLLVFAPSTTAQELSEVEIQEWEVPWSETRPRDPFVAADGMVWFVGQRADYVASLHPQSGEFQRFDLPEGAGPHNLIVDDEGMIWYAGNRAANIGRLDPTSGDVELFGMPDEGARDPHTLVFDRNGDIWFTVQGGNMVGHFARATGETRLAPVPTERSRPYGIVVDAENRPWFTEFGSNRIATVDPATMQVQEFKLPRADARPRRLGITSDASIWYVDYAGGYVGRLDASTGDVDEWPSLSGDGSRPYAMAVDDNDRIWYVESGVQPNLLVAFDPAEGEFISSTPVPSGGGTVRHMYFDANTRELWFGADTNTIGRARLP